MPENYKGWIQSYTGKQVFPLELNASMLDWRSFAHAASNICRFGGHTKRFYSIAEHSVYVSRRAGELAEHRKEPQKRVRYVRRWGLIHEGAEAFGFVDLPRPVKYHPDMKAYKKCEHEAMMVVANWAGLEPKEPWEVHQADFDLLATEARDLMSPMHPEWVREVPDIIFGLKDLDLTKPLDPRSAEQEFLLEAYRLGMWTPEE